MKITFLKANNGDCIWISFLENETTRNILIDGGIGNTYKNTSNVKGDLFNVIEKIRNENQFIDLLVLTHFDDDHIGGILRWLNKDKEASTLMKKLWFNSGKEIAKRFETDENKDLDINIVDGADDFHTSPKQGIKFEKYLTDNNLWEGKIIEQGSEHDLFGSVSSTLSASSPGVPREKKISVFRFIGG
jgi:glyoxylase-like metal-dependent hydrolase (beta-lactamase superfamily II)